MIHLDEAAFLRAIAEAPGDLTPALVFADWLDERGEIGRTEFIRVQCKLALLAPQTDRGLQERERELLVAHRLAWCEAVGVPVEDVRFERGLLAGLRLASWDGGKFLDAEYAQRLVTLTELDLSGLQIGKDGLAAFAKRAQFPSLRKLILSDNGITDAGAAVLAAATGLPRLETLYLFGNPIGNSARTVLSRSASFRLTDLDTGERADGYSLSPGEAEVARREYVRTRVLPIVSRYFSTYERLQTAVLCVAQYWADEADDAVHAALVVSELFEPTLEGVNQYGDSTADYNLPNTYIQSQYGEGSSSEISLWDAGAEWDDNSGAIPLWAAFAPEGGSQEYGKLSEAYAPAVMFYRHGGYDFLPMCRPHLDGVRPEWAAEE